MNTPSSRWLSLPWPVAILALVSCWTFVGCGGSQGTEGGGATDGSTNGSAAVSDEAGSAVASGTSKGTSGPIEGQDNQADVVASPDTPDVVPAQTSATPAANGPSLGLGDVAPPLDIAKWVKGDEVSAFESNKVYVVEFWATWCGPCKTSMPHMSSLQEEYGADVQFVGITDEDNDTVAKFMGQQANAEKTWDEVIAYTIALDNGRGTNQNYMEAAQQQGIPSAFIVGKSGKIEWIGHPMGMDDVLKAVVNDEWDVEKAKREFALESRVVAAATSNQHIFMEAGEKAQGAEGEAAKAHWSRALKAAEEVLALIPNDADSPKLVGIRQQLEQAKQWVLTESGQTEKLAAYQSELVESNWDRAQSLDQIAWHIATNQEDGDFELAEKAAQRAVALTKEKDVSSLDTLARVYSAQEKFEEAIQWQKKAVDAAPEPRMKAELTETLKEYEAARGK